MINKEERLSKLDDRAKVCPREGIRNKLDSFNKLDRCLMTDHMWSYCGKEPRVLKIVRNVFDEHHYKMFKPQPVFYLLEGIICDGKIDAEEQRCDRRCYSFWHEDWLGEAG